ncbi:proteasome subunit beta type-1, partial [Striga asiatica]
FDLPDRLPEQKIRETLKSSFSLINLTAGIAISGPTSGFRRPPRTRWKSARSSSGGGDFGREEPAAAEEGGGSQRGFAAAEGGRASGGAGAVFRRSALGPFQSPSYQVALAGMEWMRMLRGQKMFSPTNVYCIWPCDTANGPAFEVRLVPVTCFYTAFTTIHARGTFVGQRLTFVGQRLSSEKKEYSISPIRLGNQSETASKEKQK